jgi:uncharacterized lipoprotein
MVFNRVNKVYLNRKLVNVFFVAVLVLLVAACAYSPQQIVISPTVDSPAVSYGAGRAIAVTAKDNKAGQVLGSRGGIYEETSVVTIANDLGVMLTELAKQQLSDDGFSVSDLPTLGVDKVPFIELTIEDIKYELTQVISPKKLMLSVVVAAEVYNGRETYTRRYATTQNYTLIVAPTMNKNTELLNKAFSETLTRMFNDPQLKTFLSTFP